MNAPVLRMLWVLSRHTLSEIESEIVNNQEHTDCSECEQQIDVWKSTKILARLNQKHQRHTWSRNGQRGRLSEPSQHHSYYSIIPWFLLDFLFKALQSGVMDRCHGSMHAWKKQAQPWPCRRWTASSSLAIRWRKKENKSDGEESS